MKAKVLTSTAGGAVGKIADAISRSLQCKCDAVPPAYPCDKEAIVFIGVGATGFNGKANKYLSDLGKAAMRNVAFFCAPAGKAAADKLAASLSANGVNVQQEYFFCKAGLFGAKKEAAAAEEWVKKVCENLA